MDKHMKRITLCLAAMTAVLYFFNGGRKDGIIFSLFITSAVSFYHFFMRLAVGLAVKKITADKKYKGSFFLKSGRLEKKLYRLLRVKKWKSRLPTYDIESFDIKAHSPEELFKAMCQAEITHEIIAVLSFLPIFAARYFGAFYVFFITSFLASAFDLTFVFIQRYNRPRVAELLKRQKKKSSV